MVTGRSPQWWWARDRDLPLRMWPAWPLLLLGEACYKQAIAARNARYERRQRDNALFRPQVPVISVGNLTVGGSGKTPVAIWLAGLLRTRGRRPAIIARGYRAGASGLNDELRMAARKCPYAAVLANPDRAGAIQEAVATHGVDAVILDDAFQHRQVRRDLDIVLVDATRGFGNEHLLPAGPLREPVQSLSRADLVILTRADQVSSGRVASLAERMREHAGLDRPIGCLSFQLSGVTDLQFAAVESPDGRGGAFAGIGNFGSFVKTCHDNGLDVASQLPLPDHVHYDRALCDRIAQWARTGGLKWLVTTEKDAAKLSEVRRDWPVPILVLSIRVMPDEKTRILLESRVDSLLSARAAD